MCPKSMDEPDSLHLKTYQTPYRMHNIDNIQQKTYDLFLGLSQIVRASTQLSLPFFASRDRWKMLTIMVRHLPNSSVTILIMIDPGIVMK